MNKSRRAQGHVELKGRGVPEITNFLPPRGQLVILQHRQGWTLVLAIGLPRAGLDTLTKVGVRCMKEVVVVKVRVSGGGGGRRDCSPTKVRLRSKMRSAQAKVAAWPHAD